MANKKDNRRVHKTKDDLRKSLLRLLLKAPVDRITVKDICAEAGINRGTFYAHYASPEQLLSQIENEFYLDLMAEAATFEKADDVTRIFTKVLTVLKDRSEISSALFGPYGDREFLLRIVEAARGLCVTQWLGVSPEADREKIEYAFSFISFGVIRMVQKWLMEGAVTPPETLARYMNDICNYGISSVIDFSKIYPDK